MVMSLFGLILHENGDIPSILKSAQWWMETNRIKISWLDLRSQFIFLLLTIKHLFLNFKAVISWHRIQNNTHTNMPFGPQCLYRPWCQSNWSHLLIHGLCHSIPPAFSCVCLNVSLILILYLFLSSQLEVHSSTLHSLYKKTCLTHLL